MDHTTIDEQQIPERFLMGKLNEEEQDWFEEHLLHCRECAQRLELAERFRRGIKTVGAASSLEGFSAKPDRRGFFRLGTQFGLVAAAVILAAVIPTFFLRRQNTSLSDRLAKERLQRQEMALELAGLSQPQGGTALYFLSGERNATNSEAPTLQIPLPTSPGFIVLCPELAPQVHETYRVSLKQESQTLWHTSGLQPNAMETLVLSFPTSFLKAGDYHLEIRPASVDSGTAAPVQIFRFRILPQP